MGTWGGTLASGEMDLERLKGFWSLPRKGFPLVPA